MHFTERNKLRLLNLGLLFCLLGSCLMSAACQTKEQKVASILNKCQQLLDKDDLDAATKCYGAAVLANPESGGEISQAGKTAVFKKCLDYKHEKEFEKSIICLEGVAALQPDSANVNFQLADSYLQYYLQKIRINKYADKDFLDKADTLVKRSIEVDSDKGVFHETYGKILKEKSDLQRSLEEYQKATQLEPNDSLYWIDLALIQEKLGKNEEALNSYKQALIVEPNDTDALYFLGVLYEKMGRLGEAIEIIERQNKIEPPNEETLQRLRGLKERQNGEILDTKPRQKAKTA